MRTLLIGTVDGMEFSLKENCEVLCEDPNFSSMISNWALVAMECTKQKIKAGSKATLALDVAYQLENLEDADIQVDKTFDYDNETMVVHYLHVPKEIDCSKMLFLKGKFQSGEKFKILDDLSTKILDKEGKWDGVSSDMVKGYLEGVVFRFQGPTIPDKNYEIFKVLKKEMPSMIIEQACFYQHPLDPNVMY